MKELTHVIEYIQNLTVKQMIEHDLVTNEAITKYVQDTFLEDLENA